MFDSLLVINQMPHSLLCSQASKLPDHHTAAPTETSSNSSMTQFPSTSSSTTQQILTQDLPQPFPQVQSQSADRSTPPHLTSTLEHIVGQLDILTQVRTMWFFFIITDTFFFFLQIFKDSCGLWDIRPLSCSSFSCFICLNHQLMDHHIPGVPLRPAVPTNAKILTNR